MKLLCYILCRINTSKTFNIDYYVSKSKFRKDEKIIFWDSFFFDFGFNSNPFSANLREIADKSIEQRIEESWESTSGVFKEIFEKEEFHYK